MKVTKLYCIGVVVVLLLALPAVIWAQGGPDTMNFQGRLLDSSGEPRDGETHCIRFRICSDAGCSSPRWGYEYHTVTTESGVHKAGLFTVDLGTTTPIPPTLLFDYDTLWVEIGVSDNTSGCAGASYATLTPLSPLRSVAYAQRARRVRTEESDDEYLIDVYNTGGSAIRGQTSSTANDVRAGSFYALGCGVTLQGDPQKWGEG